MSKPCLNFVSVKFIEVWYTFVPTCSTFLSYLLYCNYFIRIVLKIFMMRRIPCLSMRKVTARCCPCVPAQHSIWRRWMHYLPLMTTNSQISIGRLKQDSLTNHKAVTLVVGCTMLLMQDSSVMYTDMLTIYWQNEI